MTTRVRKFSNGVRLLQHGCVLSEILREPGPTHSVFDVLSAALAEFSPGSRVGLLGFAGGGMLAPLRALGGEQAIEAVDLDPSGYQLYREVVGAWGGTVRFTEGEAARWLRSRRRRFDTLVEDLSVPVEGDVVKPAVSWEELPELMVRRLQAGGLIVSNLLPTPGIGFAEMECRVGRLAPACVVELDRFHNRILLQGRPVGSARETGRRLRGALRRLGSRLAEQVAVRSVAVGR